MNAHPEYGVENTEGKANRPVHLRVVESPSAVAAGVSPAVEGGILPPGWTVELLHCAPPSHTFPPGRMPGSPAGETPAATPTTRRCAANDRVSRITHHALPLLLLLGLSVAGAPQADAADASSTFDQANKLYEQGKFAEAAGSYEKILQGGQASAALYFNLGNALFKSGQTGRAILNYRRAEQLAPRDPDIRANLQFARNSTMGGGAARPIRWRRWISRLTLNEWTVITGAAFWLWFGLLVVGQLQPGFKKSVRGYAATTGVAVVLLGTGLGMAFYDRFHTHWAVVVAPEAVVRYGPLEESQSHYSLRDGAELIVTDQQNDWLEVVDSAGRKGWLRRDQVLSLEATADRRS